MKTQTLLSRASPLGSSLKVLKQTFSAYRGKPVQRISFVSGLHGDEFEGLYLCHRLIHALRQIQETQPEAFQGEVHIYPATNPPALNHGTRLWPFYGSDMNRMMGPHPGASIPIQMSQEIFENLKESSDLVRGPSPGPAPARSRIDRLRLGRGGPAAPRRPAVGSRPAGLLAGQGAACGWARPCRGPRSEPRLPPRAAA